MINNDTAAHPTPATTEETIQQIIADAYDPENCEQCEAVGSTCWECAQDCF